MTRQPRTKTIILGAAGRDFHDFNVYWKNQADVEVVCFTATQIPDIAGRVYPAELAGERYPEGIPIFAEDRLEALIAEHEATQVTMAYSDVSHEYVMHLASRVQAAGASFRLLGSRQTQLESNKPIVAVCAVRTGSGKSQTTRRLSEILKELGRRTAVVRHPMPYGDLTRQICQRFSSVEDMDRAECTIEEREEYEPHIAMGNLVFAGVDYEKILRRAEQEAEVILWDGGNNDLPFYRPDLHLVVADPHRVGHESRYYPGETNLRMADLVLINKVDTADPANVGLLEGTIARINPRAIVVKADSRITVSDPSAIRGKKVLVIEDGPTLTHGEMAYGAGHVAASRLGAAEIVDPRPYAKGSLRGVFEKYQHLTDILPAMGYGATQISELEATIREAPCDLVLIATPIDLARLMTIEKPSIRVHYELKEHDSETLKDAVARAIRKS
jgi:predicted GTPase